MSGDYKNNCYEENTSHVHHFQGENIENCPQAEELVDDQETTKAMNIVSFIPVLTKLHETASRGELATARRPRIVLSVTCARD